MKSAILLRTPPDFSFWRSAHSHGWCDLLPFAYNIEQQTLSRVLELADGTLVGCGLRAASGGIRISCTTSTALTAAHRSEIRTVLRTCLRMDEDFGAFYRAVRRMPEYRWIARYHAGRLLRAPTMFEDAIKMICTTNCTWALTVQMVRGLVRRFGPTDGTLTAFPHAGAIAGASEAILRKECSTGYRSRSIIELAEATASGALDIESWRTTDVDTATLFAAMCTVRGIGPYAAGNLLRLAGRYEHLGLDSWVRKQWRTLHARGRAVKDARIERFYEPHGEWRGLLFWLEMTRDWHDEKFKRKGGS
jgi:3-methyladenine DNA glycosylase/8-oxoguanine DNA glycosylase